MDQTVQSKAGNEGGAVQAAGASGAIEAPKDGAVASGAGAAGAPEDGTVASGAGAAEVLEGGTVTSGATTVEAEVTVASGRGVIGGS